MLSVIGRRHEQMAQIKLALGARGNNLHMARGEASHILTGAANQSAPPKSNHVLRPRPYGTCIKVESCMVRLNKDLNFEVFQ
jgi:hypothetical protein